MNTDLDDRFAEAWAGEPPPAPVHHLLAAGRARLARRRLAVAGGVLVAAMALSGASLAVTMSGPTDTTVSSVPSPVDPGVPSGAKGIDVANAKEARVIGAASWHAGRTKSGRIVISPGWFVTQVYRGEDLQLGGDEVDGIRFEIWDRARNQGEWYDITWDEDGVTIGFVASVPAANPGVTLQDWLYEAREAR
jgi:hypothetical protein